MRRVGPDWTSLLCSLFPGRSRPAGTIELIVSLLCHTVAKEKLYAEWIRNATLLIVYKWATHESRKWVWSILPYSFAVWGSDYRSNSSSCALTLGSNIQLPSLRHCTNKHYIISFHPRTSRTSTYADGDDVVPAHSRVRVRTAGVDEA